MNQVRNLPNANQEERLMEDKDYIEEEKKLKYNKKKKHLGEKKSKMSNSLILKREGLKLMPGGNPTGPPPRGTMA